jgi:hypothetical protein
MVQIEKEHGLKDNEYWLTSDAPAEFLYENEKYEVVLRRKKIEIPQVRSGSACRSIGE